jgi:hypothetical protein
LAAAARLDVINGGLAGLGAAIALGHPLTVLATALAAPFTSLNPFVGAGFVAAGVELAMRRPRVGDLAALRRDVTSPEGWWTNRAARTLLVFALATLGSVIGTYAAGSASRSACSADRPLRRPGRARAPRVRRYGRSGRPVDRPLRVGVDEGEAGVAGAAREQVREEVARRRRGRSAKTSPPSRPAKRPPRWAAGVAGDRRRTLQLRDQPRNSTSAASVEVAGGPPAPARSPARSGTRPRPTSRRNATGGARRRDVAGRRRLETPSARDDVERVRARRQVDRQLDPQHVDDEPDRPGRHVDGRVARRRRRRRRRAARPSTSSRRGSASPGVLTSKATVSGSPGRTVSSAGPRRPARGAAHRAPRWAPAARSGWRRGGAPRPRGRRRRVRRRGGPLHVALEGRGRTSAIALLLEQHAEREGDAERVGVALLGRDQVGDRLVVDVGIEPQRAGVRRRGRRPGAG